MYNRLECNGEIFMNFFEKIIKILDSTMTAPTNYSFFHIMFLLAVIGLTIFISIKYKNCSEKVFNKILLVFWIVIVGLEIYKQIVFSFSVSDSEAVWSYKWYAFPFQFCSTPLYVLPFVIFLNDGKIRDAFLAFISTFVLFAGLAVMVYPNDVFCETIGINIQTMIHHGSQVVLGIFCIVRYRDKLEISYCLKAIIVFACVLVIAMIMNIVIYHVFQANNIDQTFNMFFISPYFDCTLPVLSLIYPKVPYIVFLMIYIFGFALITFIIYYVSKLIINAVSKGKVNAE